MYIEITYVPTAPGVHTTATLVAVSAVNTPFRLDAIAGTEVVTPASATGEEKVPPVAVIPKVVAEPSVYSASAPVASIVAD